jgi:hypothetical protein
MFVQLPLKVINQILLNQIDWVGETAPFSRPLLPYWQHGTLVVKKCHQLCFLLI